MLSVIDKKVRNEMRIEKPTINPVPVVDIPNGEVFSFFNFFSDDNEDFYLRGVNKTCDSVEIIRLLDGYVKDLSSDTIVYPVKAKVVIESEE